LSTYNDETIACPCLKRKKKSISTHTPYYTKINAKWIVDLNTKCKTIKFLGGNREIVTLRKQRYNATGKIQEKKKDSKLDYQNLKLTVCKRCY
jgi:UDP-2,3-diacylglucosamine pyrophosphatase LpxH